MVKFVLTNCSVTYLIKVDSKREITGVSRTFKKEEVRQP